MLVPDKTKNNTCMISSSKIQFIHKLLFEKKKLTVNANVYYGRLLNTLLSFLSFMQICCMVAIVSIIKYPRSMILRWSVNSGHFSWTNSSNCHLRVDALCVRSTPLKSRDLLYSGSFEFALRGESDRLQESVYQDKTIHERIRRHLQKLRQHRYK